MSALWITEAEVVGLLDLGEAIDALEAGLRQEAEGAAKNLQKTQLSFGHGDTLHAIGAWVEAWDLVGVKSWAHTEGGATPLLTLWSAHTGALLAIVEAFALGQLRTGAMSGVATRWMSRGEADVLALYGTGKQALTQLAAVAVVRPLKSVRIFGRDAARREAFATAVRRQGYGFDLTTTGDARAAADGAGIVTLATRAKEPFFTSAMAAPGTHINAIGGIAPDREEFAPEIMPRADLVCADEPATTRRLSREFRRFYGEDDAAWAAVRPISEIVAAGAGRPAGADLTVFKAMGMGVSDLALGAEILRRARDQGLGRPLPQPERATPRMKTVREMELPS